MKHSGKRIALSALILMIVCILTAQAEIIPAYGMGQIGYSAEILCEELTIREQPDASSKAVQTLHHGDFLIVMEQKDGWAQCILSDAEDAEPAGWVDARYLAIDPARYHTEGKTAVYAWNDASAPRVGLLDGDTTMPILKQDGDWVLVGLRGAVGWINTTEK